MAWSKRIDEIMARLQAKRKLHSPSLNSAIVTGKQGGNPLGAPPAIGDDPKYHDVWAGGDGYMGGRGAPDDNSLRLKLPNRDIRTLDNRTVKRRPVPQFFPDVNGDAFGPAITNVLTPQASEDFYFGARPSQDLLVGRHTRKGNEGYASVKTFGSSSQASGPEGTIILYPPRLPRSMAGARSVQGVPNGNRILPLANGGFEIASISVVEAGLR